MNAAPPGAGGVPEPLVSDRRSVRRELLQDWALAAACLAGLVVVGFELAGSPVHGMVARAEAVAMMAFTSNEVRRRAEKTLIWEDISTGEKAYQRDTVFVPPGSSAVLRFRDGSVLQLEQDSLIVIEAPEEDSEKGAVPVNVTLQHGGISGKAGTKGMTVTTAGGSAELSAGAGARLRLDRKKRMQIDGVSGSASLRTRAGDRQLGSGASALIDTQGRTVEGSGFRVQLTQPAYGARIYFYEQAPTVSFSWRDPDGSAAALQRAADRDFTERRSSVAVEGERAHLPLAAEGNTYWRVVDAGGKPVSDTSFYVLIRDTPPVLSSPGEGEVVSATGSQPVRLAWTEVTGVAGYLVELSTDPALAKTPSRFRAEGEQYWWSGDLTEGVYYWRVRADDPERENAPFSRTGRFRLITRPLPAAPELLEVEYRF